jgi:hypothetical protein
MTIVLQPTVTSFRGKFQDVIVSLLDGTYRHSFSSNGHGTLS